jgi:mannose-6-phosphate isomerase-like protein (cupin superfamily)
MLIKQTKAKKIQNSKSCTVWNYEFLNKKISYATALINGRYPEKGKAVNLKCEQIYFVISGSGIIHSEKGNFKINKNDLYFFEAKEKYWIEGNELFVSLVNAPKWNLEQYKVVD